MTVRFHLLTVINPHNDFGVTRLTLTFTETKYGRNNMNVYFGLSAGEHFGFNEIRDCIIQDGPVQFFSAQAFERRSARLRVPVPQLRVRNFASSEPIVSVKFLA